jgi:hypothetical protein
MGGLFDTTGFIPRANCGDWSDWLIAVSVTSNVAIALAYFLIPIFLFYFWKKKRKQIEHLNILVYFLLFIFFCGCTHLLDALMFYWPAYRFLSTIDFFTAVVSIVTVWKLPKITTYFLNFKTPGEYKRLSQSLERQLTLERDMSDDVGNLVRIVEHRVERLEREITRKGWVDEQNLKLDELKELLTELRGKYNVTAR